MLNTKMIGNRIAEARKKINVSQAQLAGFIFISPQAVGKWERGESMPDITTFNRLAEILGVDLNYFSENFQSADDEVSSKAHVDSSGDTEQTVQDAVEHSPTRAPGADKPFCGQSGRKVVIPRNRGIP
jgi:transcriptional regulator with XRE-family HTH domain